MSPDVSDAAYSTVNRRLYSRGSGKRRAVWCGHPWPSRRQEQDVATTQQIRPEIEPGAPAILVVEDDRRMAAFLDRALTYAGYRVTMAEDGERALVAVDEGAGRTSCCWT